MKKETLAAKRRQLLIAQLCADAIIVGSAYFMSNNISDNKKDFNDRVDAIEYIVDENIDEDLEALKQKVNHEYNNHASLIYGLALSGLVLTTYNANNRFLKYDQLLEKEEYDDIKLKRSLKQ